MWGVTVPVLAVAGLVCFLAALLWLVRLYLTAPVSHQDRDGFHLGEEPKGDDPLSDVRFERVRRARSSFIASNASDRADKDAVHKSDPGTNLLSAGAGEMPQHDPVPDSTRPAARTVSRPKA